MIRRQRLPASPIAALFAATALLLAACAATAPSPSPDAATAVEPSPASEPATTVGPSPTPTPTLSLAERFWADFSGGEVQGPRYGSLAEIGAASDAIVVGRVTGVLFSYEQRDLGAEAAGQPRDGASVYYGEIAIAVEDVLAGTLLEPGVVRLNVVLGSPNEVGGLQELLPPGRALLFLYDPLLGPRRDKFDLFEPGLAESLNGQYILTNPGQSVVIEVDGRVAPPDSSDPFPVALTGRPFDEVVEEVRAAVR